MSAPKQFIEARDCLLTRRDSLLDAQRAFSWPRLDEFNWARDYFDVIASGNGSPALRVVDDAGADESVSFARLARRSCQLANFLTAAGVGRGDRILVMLGNVVPLWETVLAAIRLGAVIIPATTLLEHQDLADRIVRGRVKAVITHSHLADRLDAAGSVEVRIAVGPAVSGWYDYARSHDADERFATQSPTRADDPLFLYFTSGTTARPKLVVHTHASYPVGHLSTMYWLGVRPGDVHLNLSSPGWAKHAWSCIFAPWNAQACVLAYHYERFQPGRLLDLLVRCRVTTFCAPPTVWRMLIQEDLGRWSVSLREAVSAGEPLNPEVIERVRAAWGVSLRDGYGQTETTAQIGNSPGQPVKPGSMGRPLPGYPIVLLDANGRAAEEGEICIDLAGRPMSLMQGYLDDPERNASAMGDGYYHTGDIASRDADGYLTYVGRMDDVFKSSDYRISPFELESMLIEHPAVAEAAVVPSPDRLRLSVPKAFVTLAAGSAADEATALSIFEHVRARVSPYKRIRRLEFGPLPKTVSGKIRRVDLRRSEQERAEAQTRSPGEYWEEDFPELTSSRAR
ncbi:MAG TPA: AMP-binding protein [Steroidobacteraceae bacterium]|nr:AMP-binding protein [Steroidobacteraceae bacterium]